MPWWPFRSGGKPRQGERQVRLPSGLTHRLGNAMRAPHKPTRKKPKTNRTLAYVTQALSMATHNLVNMVTVTAASAAVLLILVAARHF